MPFWLDVLPAEFESNNGRYGMNSATTVAFSDSPATSNLYNPLIQAPKYDIPLWVVCRAQTRALPETGRSVPVKLSSVLILKLEPIIQYWTDPVTRKLWERHKDAKSTWYNLELREHKHLASKAYIYGWATYPSKGLDNRQYPYIDQYGMQMAVLEQWCRGLKPSQYRNRPDKNSYSPSGLN